ncbi:glycoside hydrolase family 26 protein [Paenibacillus sp. NPDC058071]|uniref:glycoside hydrolase family 26 protein n=1 Tax=Paenibacillus sp. NPDC058071 TaxID=3346326 RepID=UPI0036DA203E
MPLPNTRKQKRKRPLGWRRKTHGLIAVCCFFLLLPEMKRTEVATVSLGLQTEEAARGAANSEVTEMQIAPWSVTVQSGGLNYVLAKLEPPSGAYLGAYVLQDRMIGFSMSEFNRLTGKKHASFFKYVGYGEPFPAEWVEQVKKEGAFPHIAWEPNRGLDEVRDDVYLRMFARSAGEADVPLFIRFASEMNGSWTRYSGDPARYIEAFRMVHDVLEEEAPKAAMVWTVLSLPEKTIESYYPGDRYVDWVGVNVYNVKYHNGNAQQKADFEDPLLLLDYVYNRYSRAKPIQLSEFGATHYTATDGIKDVAFASEKIARLYTMLPKHYPRVKAIYYFNVNNLTEYNETRRVNDYSITKEPELLDAYRLGTAGEYYLSDVPPAAGDGSLMPVNETFTYRTYLFKKDGILYSDETLFTRLLRTAATKEPSTQRRIWSGYKDIGVPIMRELNAFPLEETARRLGYKVKTNGTDITIQE